MRILLVLLAALAVASCASPPERQERMKPRGHLSQESVSEAAPAPAPQAGAIPDLALPRIEIPERLERVPVIEPPEPRAVEQQTFTVVVTDVPADELLFALARDAKLNLDIHPDIEGRVTVNAIDQTLPQILRRIAQQVDLRYHIEGPTLVVEPDRPYLQTYRIDYLNISREASSDVEVALQLASGSMAGGAAGAAGGRSAGSNASSTTLRNESLNRFWETLERNIEGILSAGRETEGVGAGGQLVISNRETGVMMIRATSRQHESVQGFIDRVIASARRQVLIEATIVEVELNDRFQGGVDWSVINLGDGLSLEQAMLAGALENPPFFAGTYSDSNSDRDISGALRLLDRFGDVSVLSSPKIMALNNQTSVLKVLDNRVYFTIDVDTNTTQGVVTQTFTSNVNVVPVGFVMSVTPYVTDSDEVILNVRPSISRILGFVQDPNPALIQDDGTSIRNEIPETTVREMESVLRVGDGQVAIIGGLMQDASNQSKQGVPGLSSLPGIGKAFGYEERDIRKTELVIFLRPRVVRTASVAGEQGDYRQFLPAAGERP